MDVSKTAKTVKWCDAAEAKIAEAKSVAIDAVRRREAGQPSDALVAQSAALMREAYMIEVAHRGLMPPEFEFRVKPA